MSRPRKRGCRLFLSDRAVADIAAIKAYSTKEWGKSAAAKYQSDISAGMRNIRHNPELLRAEPTFHAALRFYRVRKHLLVCDVRAKVISVVMVIHASMDIPTRLAELEPTLSREVDILRRRTS